MQEMIKTVANFPISSKVNVMNMNILKYSIPVFLAGVSYGVLATVVKLAFAAGFSFNQVVASQTLGGFLIFIGAFAIVALVKNSYQKVSAQQVLRMIGLGLVAATTTVCYGFALSMMPVAVALTLLFQFVWIGIIIQVVTTKRRPRPSEVLAALMVLGGTLLGSGLFESHLEGIDPLGIVFGLISAISCAFFVFLSGKVETDVPHIQRGMTVSLGTVIVGLAVCPDFFTSGVIQQGIWKYGLFLGAFAYVGPIVLLGIGTPHLSTGLGTVLTSAELPFGIIFSSFVLGEVVSVLQVIGIIAVLGGVVVSQLPYLVPKKELSRSVNDPPT